MCQSCMTVCTHGYLRARICWNVVCYHSLPRDDVLLQSIASYLREYVMKEEDVKVKVSNYYKYLHIIQFNNIFFFV